MKQTRDSWSQKANKNVYVYVKICTKIEKKNNRTQSKTVKLIKHLNDSINGTRLVFFFFLKK